VRWATVTHDGVTIRYMQAGPNLAPGVQPAYAVTDGMGIIATSPEEVEAVLDTKAGAPSAATAPNFVAALSHKGSTRGDVVYVDLESLIGMLGSGGDVPGDLLPLRSLIVTDHYGADLISERVFLSVE
jgi:hypothetical protein